MTPQIRTAEVSRSPLATPAGTIKAGAHPHRRRTDDPEWTEERGVYVARHTYHHRRILYAVDSTGDVMHWETVALDEDPGPAIARLWAALDADDPPHRMTPSLALVIE